MRKNKAGKPPSQRQLRVGEIVRHELISLLQRETLTDDRIEKSIISISEVSMSPDLQKATAWIFTIGTDAHPVVEALNSNAKFIRGRLTPALRQMKYMPSIYFRVDSSFDNYKKINDLLKAPNVLSDLMKCDNDDTQLVENSTDRK